MFQLPSVLSAFVLAYTVLADASLSTNRKHESIDSAALQKSVTLPALMSHAQAFQNFAYAYPERNRFVGTAGHNDTVTYIKDQLESLGGFYDVTLQPFEVLVYVAGDYELFSEGSPIDTTLFTYAPNGDVDDTLVNVSNVGCEPEDFPPEVAGHIALILRGTCPFGLKVALAGAAKAAGVIIYNNVEGIIQGTLSDPERPEGPYVPALSVSQAQGHAWVARLEAGENVPVHMIIANSFTGYQFTNNVIAETVEGDKNNVLHVGAHSDSVVAGPGINDNGSGSISILEVALQLSNHTVHNAVRFSWWSAEEVGLKGAEYYVSQLSQEEIAKIRLYLNFDMIASPNYALTAYDGDGSDFNITGPAGSAEVEQFFYDYYASAGVNFTSSPFNGRSDYGPFLEVGVACGGLATGAEGIKTEEEAEMFGGVAGIAYDPNYHLAGDKIDNLAQDALLINARGIAAAVAEYGSSWDSMPPKETARPFRTAAVSTSLTSSQPKLVWKGDELIA